MRDPSKNQLTSVTQGLALTIHSKYMSIPSVIACGSIRAPSTILTRGISVCVYVWMCESVRIRMQRKGKGKEEEAIGISDEMKKKEAGGKKRERGQK